MVCVRDSAAFQGMREQLEGKRRSAAHSKSWRKLSAAGS